MKLEDLKVGQYIRTKFGIKQIYEIDEHKTKWKYLYKLKKQDGDECIDLGVLSSEDIVKASFNIADIIEKGDYINGVWVNDIINGRPIHEDYNDPYYSFGWDNEDIKTIITHEQMEQMSYKLGE